MGESEEDGKIFASEPLGWEKLVFMVVLPVVIMCFCCIFGYMYCKREKFTSVRRSSILRRSSMTLDTPEVTKRKPPARRRSSIDLEIAYAAEEQAEQARIQKVKEHVYRHGRRRSSIGIDLESANAIEEKARRERKEHVYRHGRRRSSVAIDPHEYF